MFVTVFSFFYLHHFNLHLEPNLNLIPATLSGFASIPNSGGVVDLRTVELSSLKFVCATAGTRVTDIYSLRMAVEKIWVCNAGEIHPIQNCCTEFKGSSFFISVTLVNFFFKYGEGVKERV